MESLFFVRVYSLARVSGKMGKTALKKAFALFPLVYVYNKQQHTHIEAIIIRIANYTTLTHYSGYISLDEGI